MSVFGTIIQSHNEKWKPLCAFSCFQIDFVVKYVSDLYSFGVLRRPSGAASPTSVRKSVPKSRFSDCFSLKGEAMGGGCNVSSQYGRCHLSSKGFSPEGRSCHPLALRNQWMTDVGLRRRRRSMHFPGEKCFGKFAVPTRRWYEFAGVRSFLIRRTADRSMPGPYISILDPHYI